MTEERLTYTMDEVFEEIRKDPEYQKIYRMQKPYYDIVSGIVGLMIKTGFDREKISELSKIKPNRLVKIISADCDPKISELVMIAEALGASLEIEFKEF